MTLPAGRSVSICTKSTGHLEEAVLQVLVTLDVFWAERVNLQEKYDDPKAAIDLDTTFEDEAANAKPRPKLHKAGKAQARRGIVVRSA